MTHDGTAHWESVICPQCGQDHADQRTKYPIGAKVRTLIDIPAMGGSVRAATTGEVIGHCDDGRATLRLDSKPPTVHTFHHPGGVIAVEMTPGQWDIMDRVPDIWGAICRERNYQDRKYGSVQQRNLAIGEYLAIMRRELVEADEAPSVTDSLREILQVAAVAVAALERHGVVERETRSSI